VLAGLLFDSLHNKLLTLPDEVTVYPGHGAGSLCGRNLGTSRCSTIRTERLTNYALQVKERGEFIRELTRNLPPRPAYFPQDAQINRAGAPALQDLPKLTAVKGQELDRILGEGGVVIDVRTAEEFAAGHVPGSINIPLSGQFASWAGTLIDLDCRPVLIAENTEELDEARTRLARIGLDLERGYSEGGVNGWKNAGYELELLDQIHVRDLNTRLESEGVRVLDVRRAGEWQAGHIGVAMHHPLDGFKVKLPDLNRSETVFVMCKGGYRSSIACSMLQRAGFKDVINVIGGYDAWSRTGLATVTEQRIAA
jgi:hydroxyacylglutathione hydrolase